MTYYVEEHCGTEAAEASKRDENTSPTLCSFLGAPPPGSGFCEIETSEMPSRTALAWLGIPTFNHSMHVSRESEGKIAVVPDFAESVVTCGISIS